MKQGILLDRLGSLFKFVVILFTRIFFMGRFEGIDHVPKKGPFIIVANHSSYLDHFLISTVLKTFCKTEVYYLTKKEAFGTPISRLWHISLGCIPLDRSSTDTKALRSVLQYLRDGKVVVIYPEGTRSPTGHLMPVKSGPIKLALLGKVPILPIGLSGSFDTLPKGKRIPRLIRSKIRIGKPFYFHQQNLSKVNANQMAHQVMEEVVRLTGEQLPGIPVEVTIGDTELDMSAEELVKAATGWNERGIRRKQRDPLPEEICYRRALYICRVLLKRDPTHVSALFEYGRALGRLSLISNNPLQKALLARRSKRIFEKTIQLNQDYAHAHYALGMWHLYMPPWMGGSKQTAISEYTKSVQLDPTEIFLYMGLANCQLKLGLIEEAANSYLQVVNLESKRPEDLRRKLEAASCLLRIDYHFESRLDLSCLNGSQKS